MYLQVADSGEERGGGYGVDVGNTFVVGRDRDCDENAGERD